jgi:nucleotide-binding universal stress UspA family protein
VGTVLGSTALWVSAHAHCPLVVVRGDSSHSYGPERPVVVGADGSVSSQNAVRYAADAAARASAPLKVVTAFQSPASQTWASAYVLQSTDGPTPDSTLQETAEKIAVSASEMARGLHPRLDVREYAVHGPFSKALCEAASGCGLLMLGSRGRSGFATLVLGSVSHGAIHSGPCPVVVVRTTTIEAAATPSAGRVRAVPAYVVG